MYIPFEGHITRSDLTNIFTLAFKRILWLTYLCVPLFVIFTGALIISVVRDIFYPFWLMGMLFTGFIASYPLWAPPASARRVFQQQTELRGTYAGTISEEEITLRTINTTTNIKWAIYSKIVRDENTVLLYQNARFFNYFPRTLFASAEDWQAFQALLDSKVQKGVLKEMTGRFDLGLGTEYPRWAVILMIVGIGLLVICLLIALVFTLIYRGAQ